MYRNNPCTPQHGTSWLSAHRAVGPIRPDIAKTSSKSVSIGQWESETARVRPTQELVSCGTPPKYCLNLYADRRVCTSILLFSPVVAHVWKIQVRQVPANINQS